MAKKDTNNNEEQVTLLTKEGLKKLQDELSNLKTVRRKEVAARIKEAISYGDLSENSEYEDAKNEQAFTEGRILALEEMVKHAKIITDKGKGTKTVQIGTKVVIQNISTKGDKEEYMIVGSTEADPFEHRISNESPIGHALLDKKQGDEVIVEAPIGKIKYKILKLA